MSLATWKQEFYPVEATEVAKEDALKHSLQKWTGFEQANLDKHGVGLRNGRWVMDESGTFAVDAASCALCITHPECKGCPLVQARGVSCCSRVGAEEFPPWQQFVSRSDPGPMLALLRKAKEREGAK